MYLIRYIHTYMTINKLKINYDKTNLMVIRKNKMRKEIKNNLRITMDGIEFKL